MSSISDSNKNVLTQTLINQFTYYMFGLITKLIITTLDNQFYINYVRSHLVFLITMILVLFYRQNDKNVSNYIIYFYGLMFTTINSDIYIDMLFLATFIFITYEILTIPAKIFLDNDGPSLIYFFHFILSLLIILLYKIVTGCSILFLGHKILILCLYSSFIFSVVNKLIRYDYVITTKNIDMFMVVNVLLFNLLLM